MDARSATRGQPTTCNPPAKLARYKTQKSPSPTHFRASRRQPNAQNTNHVLLEVHGSIAECLSHPCNPCHPWSTPFCLLHSLATLAFQSSLNSIPSCSIPILEQKETEETEKAGGHHEIPGALKLLRDLRSLMFECFSPSDPCHPWFLPAAFPWRPWRFKVFNSYPC
jgi:hypothetical protein